MYHAGDEFIFERYGDKDDFWHEGYGAQCSEAWDAISRYIYTALQGGSIMHGWTNDDRMMIACCSDGTRTCKSLRSHLAESALTCRGHWRNADGAAPRFFCTKRLK